MIETIKKYLEKNFYFLDKETIEKLAKKAVSSLKEEIEDLKDALKGSNKEEILKLSHKIKGNLLNNGFSELAKEFNDDMLKNFSLEEIKEKLSSSIKKVSSLL